ncbi:hypothetical protein [Dongia sedimenti]|uniref:Glycosyltransferase RgtA/B/C/D-like domain-containing protein n=1 Tax=Dongia sedimenti TaxID=3064282 RepID=A0ABU0YP28_9PROT|nr:hypothetical protein [Rhodospirillaceae bacterium R-7]
MSEAQTSAAPRKPVSPRAISWLLIGLFAALAIGEHIFFAFKNGAVLRDHGLVDTDSYMRVLRILDLYNGAGWYNTMTDRLGAPEGLSLHWTRPVDILILLPALLAHAVGVPIDRAVYWVGASFSSLCHLLACFAAAWAAKPLWPSPGHRFAAVILLTNAAAFGYGIFGRADHHTLLLLLTALMLGCMLRAALAGTPEDARRHWAAWGGGLAGLGVWVSPEMMVPIVPVIATFGLFWLDAPLDRKRVPDECAMPDWAMAGAAFSLAMAAVVLAAIPIEQPPAHWLKPEYDKVSVPYLVLPLIWAAVFLAAQRVRGGVAMRGLAGAVLAVAGFGLILLLFPDLLFGPLSVDPRLNTDFLDTVQEMQPLWPTSIERLRNFLPLAGQSVTAIVLLPFAFRAWRRDSGEGKRWSALLLTMAFGFMLIGALLHARLGVELAPTMAIICAGFFHLAEQKLEGRSRLLRTPALVLAAVWLTCGPLLSLAFLPPAPEGVGCPVGKLGDWLNAARPGKGSAPIVMTDDFSYAPELAFRTPYRFVAGPYHRNPQAIFDTVDTMLDQNGETARSILEKRQVSLVIRCVDVVVPRLFVPDHVNFYADLGRANPPAWLTQLTLPPELSPHFRVYEVNGR